MAWITSTKPADLSSSDVDELEDKLLLSEDAGSTGAFGVSVGDGLAAGFFSKSSSTSLSSN